MMMHCNSQKASMRAEHFLYFNNSRIYGKDFVSVNAFKVTTDTWAIFLQKINFLQFLNLLFHFINNDIKQ